MNTTPLELAISAILWPPNTNPHSEDNQWDAETISDIADAFLNLRPDLVPPGERP